MNTTLVSLYRRVKNLHEEVYIPLVRARQGNNHANEKELADAAYVLREIERLANDIEKEARLSRELMEKLACAVVLETSNEDKIRTKYCTATLDLKTMRSIPKRDDLANYVPFMSSLGVDPAKVELDLVRPHWPSLVEHITSLERNGKNPPPGMGKDSYNLYRLIIRKKPGKEITD